MPKYSPPYMPGIKLMEPKKRHTLGKTVDTGKRRTRPIPKPRKRRLVVLSSGRR